MLRYIIKKEALEIMTSPKFVFTFVICTVLILMSFYSGIVNYVAELKEYNAASALSKSHMSAQTDIQNLMTIGLKINRRPQVLGTVVNGLEEAVGRVAPISMSSDPNLIESKYDGNPVFAVFGSLDIMFIVKIILSLFTILFTFDLIVGEKERGTLQLALSNSVPRDTFLLGKAIGGYISLIFPLLIPTVLGLFMLILSPDISLSPNDWIRMLLIVFMFFLYLSVFFSLGLFVSSRTTRSSTSFLVLLFIWALFVMVIPKAAVLAAARIRPIPSMHEITNKKEAFLQQLRAEQSAAVAKWMQSLPADVRNNTTEFYKRLAERGIENQQDLNSKLDANNAAVERDYQLKKNSQLSLALAISRISPASALTFGTMSLARTGVEECDRFLASVRIYKRDLSAWMNSILGQVGGRMGKAARPGLAPMSLGEMPQWKNDPETFSDSFARTIPDIGLMFVLIVLFFTGGYVSFRGYDVR